MSAKHTPEAWVADTDVSVVGYEEHDGKIFVIADVYGRPGFADERAANANLIAAAPALLEAVTACLTIVPDPRFTYDAAAVFAKARAAIATALGQNAD